MVASINASTSAGVVTTADTSGILALQTAGTTAVTLDASQNATFAGTATATKLIPTGSSVTGNGMYLPAANSLGLSTNGSARVQIYSDGVTKVISTGTSNPTYSFTNYGEGLMFSNGDNAGTRYSDIVSLANTPAGATSNMRFWTNEGSGAGPATEKMRIDTGGNLLVGTTSQLPGGTSKLVVDYATGDFVAGFRNSNASPLGLYVFQSTDVNGGGNPFIYCVGGLNVRFSFKSNGGINNFSANNTNLSDRREKINFAPAKSYLNTICSIPVQTFNYIDQSEDDPGLTLGVVAQDVQAVAPEMVTESNWGTEEAPKMRLSIYQTDLQYALMKSIQELKAINDTQAETINALTARIVALEK